MQNPRRRQQNRRAPAQRPGPSFNQHATIPWRFPAFPRQIQFSSKWSQTLDVNLGVANYNRIVGLFSYNGQIPQYALSLYNLYRYSRITGVHIALTLSPDVTGEYSAVEMAMARIPYDEAASVFPATLHIVRGSKYALASSGPGAPQTKIQGTWASFDELGNPVFEKAFWQTRAEATSTSLDADEPVVAVAIRAVNAQSATVSVNLEVTYHMEYFDLEIDDEVSVALLEPKLERRSKIASNANLVSRLADNHSQRDISGFEDMSDKPAPRRR